MEREQRVRGSERRSVGAKVERLLHGSRERLAVVFERVGEADLAPKLRLETAVGRQLDGTTQEPEPLVDVVPADRELRSATKPVERLLSQRLELLLLAH